MCSKCRQSPGLFNYIPSNTREKHQQPTVMNKEFDPPKNVYYATHLSFLPIFFSFSITKYNPQKWSKGLPPQWVIVMGPILLVFHYTKLMYKSKCRIPVYFSSNQLVLRYCRYISSPNDRLGSTENSIHFSLAVVIEASHQCCCLIFRQVSHATSNRG